MPQKRMECFKLLLDHLVWIEHQFLSGIIDSRKAGSLWGVIRGMGEVRKSIHLSWLAKGSVLGLRLQTFWPRWALRHFFSLPIVQNLLPVTFGYSLTSQAVVMRQLRRWKRQWRRSLTRSHKRTSMGPSRSCRNGTTSALQLVETTSKGTRVSCVYYQ